MLVARDIKLGPNLARNRLRLVGIGLLLTIALASGASSVGAQSCTSRNVSLSPGNDNFTDAAGFASDLNALGGNDTVEMGNCNDQPNGGAGLDELHGAAGVDILYGGGGDDHIFGGSENDSMLGQANNDTLDDSAGTGDMDGLFGIGGNDTIFAQDGDNIDNVDGGVGSDSCFIDNGGEASVMGCP